MCIHDLVVVGFVNGALEYVEMNLRWHDFVIARCTHWQIQQIYTRISTRAVISTVEPHQVIVRGLDIVQRGHPRATVGERVGLRSYLFPAMFQVSNNGNQTRVFLRQLYDPTLEGWSRYPPQSPKDSSFSPIPSVNHHILNDMLTTIP